MPKPTTGNWPPVPSATESLDMEHTCCGLSTPTILSLPQPQDFHLLNMSMAIYPCPPPAIIHHCRCIWAAARRIEFKRPQTARDSPAPPISQGRESGFPPSPLQETGTALHCAILHYQDCQSSSTPFMPTLNHPSNFPCEPGQASEGKPHGSGSLASSSRSGR